jgi:crotonobetainyl-CoA:carnitine CoA-transferase CaiB-like acyl-CoA transferase
LLADLGADVVHVETSTRPDRMGATRPSPGSEGRSLFSFNTNRNKRSIAINLKMEAGHNLATRMATVADVLVENFSAGVMARLKLDYERLWPLNQGLIYVSMSGYGQNGPRRDWTSMNMNLQGYSGLTMVTGSENDPPTGISNSWNDYIGGLHACFGIFQALHERAVTGVGANLDLSQFECSVATLASLLLGSGVNHSAPPRLGNRSTHAAPQGVYRCAGSDEWCVIVIQSDMQWHALLTVLGNPSWGRDSRFETLVGRLRHQDEIDPRIEAWTSELANAEVERRLKAVGIPAERMRRIKDVIEGPDAAQVFRPMEDPGGRSVLVTGVPFAFSHSSLSPLRAAPGLGEHTQAVLEEWLSLAQGEIKALEEQGALA